MKSNDLISRETALSAIDNERNILIEQERLGAEHIVVHHARRLIEDLPAMDAVPVVHARLIKYEPDMHGTEPVGCSACNYLFARLYPHKYCPNCGAKLDARDEDDAKAD